MWELYRKVRLTTTQSTQSVLNKRSAHLICTAIKVVILLNSIDSISRHINRCDVTSYSCCWSTLETTAKPGPDELHCSDKILRSWYALLMQSRLHFLILRSSFWQTCAGPLQRQFQKRSNWLQTVPIGKEKFNWISQFSGDNTKWDCATYHNLVHAALFWKSMPRIRHKRVVA